MTRLRLAIGVLTVAVCAPQIHNRHGADERAADSRELHVVGVDAATLQGEIHHQGEGIVQHVR